MLEYCTYKNAVIDRVYLGNKPVFTFPLTGNPDRRLVTTMYGDSNGLKFWNSPKDPMPIQGLDMSKGIEFYCKEYIPDSHKIYTDGRVELFLGYAGVGDMYNSAIQTIYEEETARGYNIQDPNHITSDIEFHSMLVHQMNLDNIAKVEREQAQLLSVRNVLEEEIPPLVKTEQRVITAINFCCRVDLEDGSIYIGEGYENLVQQQNSFFDGAKINSWNSDGSFTLSSTKTIVSYVTFTREKPCVVGDVYSLNYEIVKNNENFRNLTVWKDDFETNIVDENNYIATCKNRRIIYGFLFYLNQSLGIGITADIRAIITKTSTPKPFVKSHMPSGKLAFITNATSQTHSFVFKNINAYVKPTGIIRFYQTNDITQGYERTHIVGIDTVQNNIIKNDNVLISTKYSHLLKRNIPITIADQGKIGGGFFCSSLYSKENIDSFSQLLIYQNDERGGMTQVELESELAKDIKLI